MHPVLVGIVSVVGAAIVLYVLRRAFVGAVEDVVDTALAPLSKRLTDHMEREESAHAETRAAMDEVKALFQVNEYEHVHIKERLERLERG